MKFHLPTNSRNSILKAPYIGFINLDAPTFGDIAVLAKGKLKKNADKTFSFEQINERCDEKCQINADKYLENVTALWMVERIRHRDIAGHGHRYDLKFTIVPIYHDKRHQIDHNILENRLKNQIKRTFIMRDSDYPSYFQTHSNRRSDLFSPGFERSISSFMNIDPNNLMQNLLGINMSPQSQKSKMHPKDTRLNKGEFYMMPKIMNSARAHFHPTVNSHALHNHDHQVRFPDSREMTIKKPPMSHYRPKPELYNNNRNIVDYRGANDNVFVGSSDHQLTQPNHQFNQQNLQHLTPSNLQHLSHQQQHHQPQQPITVPVFQIPVDMPLIQISQTPGYYQGAFPFQIQLSTPPNQQLYAQPDVTTFRYQPQLIGLSNHPSQQLYNQYVPLNIIPENKSKQFQESERHTMNHYSPPDPVYHHQQSTTEAPIHASTYSPRYNNNYANVLRPQIDTPAMSTASSRQVNMYDDDDFQPITPSYDIRKFKSTARGSTTKKPDSINDQLVDAYSDITIPYVTLPSPKASSENYNEVSYKVVADRPKSSSPKIYEKTSEKPVLKWIPKKQRNKLTNVTSSITPIAQQSFIPTIVPIESTAATEPPAKSTTQFFRGRNRFNKRNSSSSANVRAATISPSKIARKKTTSSATSTSVASTPSPASFATTSTFFPTYMTPHGTEEPITSLSLSTSISLEVNGERIYDPTTTIAPGYELIPAGVESIDTNTTNVKLFKASVVPEGFDNLTFSILNHAKVLENLKIEN